MITPASLPPWCQARETHSGSVVLMGDLAYKFKKPVDLGFLDFTSREVRERVCEREVELNRRLAPDVYLGVGHLVGADGSVEPAVVMRRLPDDLRLSHLVRSGRATTDQVRAIARQVAAFHARAATGPDIIRHGTLDALRGRWQDNIDQVRAMSTPHVDARSLDEIESLVHQFLAGRKDLFDDRIRRGAVVDGHGDLTPDDIFCLPDGPRLLDCLEFDDALRSLDRLDDIAFLAMGLGELGAPGAAHTLLETWAECTGDPAPESLVHHYIAYRAFVRAKVGCLSGAQQSGAGVGRYVDTTLAHLRAGAVKLILVGGPPASGKTTLAGAVADRLGMTVISSDRVRKELAGLDPRSSAAAGFEHGIYSAEHTRATYATLLHRAGRLLRLGESVVLDATWSTTDERHCARRLAHDTAADLVELRCSIDEETALQRLGTREALSDADEDVAVRMRRAADPWPTGRPVDTGLPLADSVDLASAVIRPHPSPLAVLRRRSRIAPD